MTSNKGNIMSPFEETVGKMINTELQRVQKLVISKDFTTDEALDKIFKIILFLIQCSGACFVCYSDKKTETNEDFMKFLNDYVPPMLEEERGYFEKLMKQLKESPNEMDA